MKMNALVCPGRPVAGPAARAPRSPFNAVLTCIEAGEKRSCRYIESIVGRKRYRDTKHDISAWMLMVVRVIDVDEG